MDTLKLRDFVEVNILRMEPPYETVYYFVWKDRQGKFLIVFHELNDTKTKPNRISAIYASEEYTNDLGKARMLTPRGKEVLNKLLPDKFEKPIDTCSGAKEAYLRLKQELR